MSNLHEKVDPSIKTQYTLPTLKDFKKEAKILGKKMNLSTHTEALNALSKEYGYKNYNVAKSKMIKELHLQYNLSFPIDKGSVIELVNKVTKLDGSINSDYFKKEANNLLTILIDIVFSSNNKNELSIEDFKSLFTTTSLERLLHLYNNNSYADDAKEKLQKYIEKMSNIDISNEMEIQTISTQQTIDIALYLSRASQQFSMVLMEIEFTEERLFIKNTLAENSKNSDCQAFIFVTSPMFIDTLHIAFAKELKRLQSIHRIVNLKEDSLKQFALSRAYGFSPFMIIDSKTLKLLDKRIIEASKVFFGSSEISKIN